MKYKNFGIFLSLAFFAFSPSLDAMEYHIKSARAEGKVFTEGTNGRVSGYVFQEGKFREVTGFISGKGMITVMWKKDNNRYKIEKTRIISSTE